MRRVLHLAIACGLACLGSAQADLTGPGRFPQFRGLSALPGSGFGVMPDGTISFLGAMSFTTPIAYSISDWDIVVSGSVIAPDFSIAVFDTERGEGQGNGTIQALAGVPLGEYGRGTFGTMILSSEFDTAESLLFTPSWQPMADWTWAFGVQDISGQGGTQGEGPTGEDPGESRSYFLVATTRINEDAYASVGFGDTRFSPVFGNASYNLSDRVKLLLEYDAFHWNGGVAYDIGEIGNLRSDRPAHATAVLGVVAGKYLYWVVSLDF